MGRVDATPGVPNPGAAPVLPAIVAAIDRLEASIERLSAIVESSTSDAHRSSVASANSLADHLEAVTALFSSQLAHLDRHGADLGDRIDSMQASVAAPLAEHAAAHAAQADANTAALQELAARVATVGAGFAGPLDELSSLVSARLDEVTRALGARLDALAATVDDVANAPAPPPPPAPPVDLSALDAVQRSLDELSAQVDVLTSRPSPDDAPFDDVQRAVEGLSARVDMLVTAPSIDPVSFEGMLRMLDGIAAHVDALVSAPQPPPPPPQVPEPRLAPAPSKDTKRLLSATEELAAQVASLHEELTQLKRRVGVRAKVPIVLDDAQMDDIARRVAGVVTAELVRSFEVTE